MATIEEALALAALADNPTANIVPSGWLFDPVVSTQELNYSVYINTNTKEISIAFGDDLDDQSYGVSLLATATLQTPVNPGTLLLMREAATLVLDLYATTQPGYSGLNPNPGYSVFVTGAGRGGAAAEYAMEQVLAHYPAAQTDGSISGMSFGGPGLSDASNFQTGVNFTSYVLESDIFATSPLVPYHVGTEVGLTATVQDYITDIVVPALTTFLPEGKTLTKIASKVIEKVAEKLIKGGTIVDYANALLQQGYIQSNPLKTLNPTSSIFNFSLSAALPDLTGYVQTINSSPTIIESQSGTISVDGVTQDVALTNFVDGTTTLVVSEDPNEVQATQTTIFGVNGNITQTQIGVAGATITLSGSESALLTSSIDGSLIVVFFPTNMALGDFGLIANPDGTTALVGVDTATGIAQEVVDFAAGGLSNDTINVTEDSSGTVYVNADVANAGTVEIGTSYSTASTNVRYTFTSSNSFLKLDDPWSFDGTIYGAITGDFVELIGVTSAQILQFGSRTDPTFRVEDPRTGKIATIQFAPTEDFNNAGFAIGNLLGNGDLTIEVLRSSACFVAGTRIESECGERAVEKLAVGDRVRTLSGAMKPIVWIGMGRDLVTRANKLARPVIVRRGALADEVPARDLYLTHGHALYLDGVLIPVENLINHHSIEWDERARVVEYYHIELEDHDVLFANGAPAESYYDAHNRALFQTTRDGSKPGTAKPSFAPILNGGDTVERVWAELFKRSGGRIETRSTVDPDLHLLVGGVRLDPEAIDSAAYNFTLVAPSIGPLLLRSRCGVPSLLGVTEHDHRRLGIALSRVELRQPGILTELVHESPLLATGGCHAPENGYCWTDGELELPARLFAHLDGPFTLTVHTEKPGMRYPISPTVAKVA